MTIPNVFLCGRGVEGALPAVWQFVTDSIVPVCARKLSVKVDEGLEDRRILGGIEKVNDDRRSILRNRS